MTNLRLCGFLLSRWEFFGSIYWQYHRWSDLIFVLYLFFFSWNAWLLLLNDQCVQFIWTLTIKLCCYNNCWPMKIFNKFGIDCIYWYSWMLIMFQVSFFIQKTHDLVMIYRDSFIKKKFRRGKIWYVKENRDEPISTQMIRYFYLPTSCK